MWEFLDLAKIKCEKERKVPSPFDRLTLSRSPIERALSLSAHIFTLLLLADGGCTKLFLFTKKKRCDPPSPKPSQNK